MPDHPWDRRKKETGRAHRGLLDYCIMGEARSLRGLRRLYLQRQYIIDTAEKPPTTSLDTLFNWSSKYDWPDRAGAWDEHHQTREQRKWAERFEGLREKEWAISETMLEKVAQMLRFPVTKVEREDDTGITIVMPADWKVRDAARLMEAASKLGRGAAGIGERDVQEVEVIIRKIGGGMLEGL